MTDSPLALIIGASSLALLAGALAFQYIGGLAPCVLCIWQRWPHVIVMALCVIAVFARTRAGLSSAVLALAGLTLLGGAGIAGFHVGVEQGWWAGTASCGGSVTPASSLEALRAQILSAPVVRCDAVAWSLFGISMAGWNLLLSAGLGSLALFGALTRMRRMSQWVAPTEIKA